MRSFFTEGFREKGRKEPVAEFALRKKALQDALSQVQEGKLDRTYANKGDGSKLLRKLRGATQGAGVNFYFCFCFFKFLSLILFLSLCVCFILWKIGLNLRSGQVYVSPVGVGDSDDEEEMKDTGAAVDEAAFTDGLDAEPVSQLTVVKKTVRRTLHHCSN